MRDMTTTTCRWCGYHHTGACPRVKAMEYRPDGSLKRVEFHEPKPHVWPIGNPPQETVPFRGTITIAPPPNTCETTRYWISHPTGDGHWVAHPS